MTCWSKGCLYLIGKTAKAKIYSTSSQYGEDFEIQFERSYDPPQSTGPDISEISKKLDRILKILEDKDCAEDSLKIVPIDEPPAEEDEDDTF
jgi:hypothetical protein